jgi:hypothetical protein
MSYTLDKCNPEFELTAEIEGGVPFVSSNGEAFYKYDWQLNSDEFGVLQYTGKTITVKYPGDLSLTVQDSKGCIVDITSADKIQIKNEISIYYLEEGLSLVNSQGATPTTTPVFALEPTCADPERDNGKIKFNVKGGNYIDGNNTISYPYTVQWEKYDTPTGLYIVMDGTNGLQDLSNQEFANDLLPGQYRVTVEPSDWDCTVNSIDSGIGITKVIIVPQNDDLIITNGPLIDVSEYNFTDGSDNICKVGGSGYLYVNVFNNYEGEISFDYENVPLTQVDRMG